ncbi:MAG: ferredoxin--nitrite reductase, partial [Nitrospirales bacterium]
AKVGQGLKPITMHWSGCPAGCGNHLVADIGLLGKKTKVDGKVVDAVDVFIGGRSGPDPKPALKLLEDVPCEDLPEVLAGLVRYHSREKLHRVRGADVKKPVPVTPASGGSPSAELPPVRAPLWTPA